MLLGLVFGFLKGPELACGAPQVPFDFRDGFIWVHVTSPASQRTLNFLVDSGAQVSVINASTAMELGLKGGRPVQVIGVGTSTSGTWPQALDARAGSIELPQNYLKLDLSELSNACTNGVVDGIIGADFFRDKVVQIDFARRTLRILREATAPAGNEVLPLKVRPCGMLVQARINDSKPQWIRLDTGCASALQWVTAAVRQEACTKRIAVALSSFPLRVTQTSLKLGSLRFDAVPTDVQPKEIFPGEKGLLGNALLSRFQTVTINTKGKEVILGPLM